MDSRGFEIIDFQLILLPFLNYDLFHFSTKEAIMALKIVCPKCKHWNSIEAESCGGVYRSGQQKGKRCSVKNLKKNTAKLYAIDVRINGKRFREIVGKHRLMAEEKLIELDTMKDDQEEVISSSSSKSITVGSLFDWYLDLPSTKALAAFRRVKVRTKALRRVIGSSTLVSDLSPRLLENYVSVRGSEDSPMKIGKKIAPKTVKEELNLLRAVLNLAYDYDQIRAIPVKTRLYPKINFENTRKRIFTEDELNSIFEISPLWLRRIIIMAQGTGMRQNEIIQLNWDSVDLQRGFVQLSAHETKTRESRLVRLLPHVIEMLEEIPRFDYTRRVFLSVNDQPIPYWHSHCGDTFRRVLEKAGISDACFHDFRHDFVTKAWRAGNRVELIMKQTGHKTDSMFRRYNLIDENVLVNLSM